MQTFYIILLKFNWNLTINKKHLRGISTRNECESIHLSFFYWIFTHRFLESNYFDWSCIYEWLYYSNQQNKKSGNCRFWCWMGFSLAKKILFSQCLCTQNVGFVYFSKNENCFTLTCQGRHNNIIDRGTETYSNFSKQNFIYLSVNALTPVFPRKYT